MTFQQKSFYIHLNWTKFRIKTVFFFKCDKNISEAVCVFCRLAELVDGQLSWSPFDWSSLSVDGCLSQRAPDTARSCRSERFVPRRGIRVIMVLAFDTRTRYIVADVPHHDGSYQFRLDSTTQHVFSVYVSHSLHSDETTRSLARAFVSQRIKRESSSFFFVVHHRRPVAVGNGTGWCRCDSIIVLINVSRNAFYWRPATMWEHFFDAVCCFVIGRRFDEYNWDDSNWMKSNLSNQKEEKLLVFVGHR